MKKMYCFWWWVAAWLTSFILLSYYPADATWWYYSSQPVPHHHPFGWWGATCAALLYMGFGYAAWGIPLIMCGIGVCLYRERSYEHTVIFFAYSMIMCISSALLCTYYHIAAWGIPAGGVFGLLAYHMSAAVVQVDHIPYVASALVGLCGTLVIGRSRIGRMTDHLYYGAVRYIQLPFEQYVTQRVSQARSKVFERRSAAAAAAQQAVDHAPAAVSLKNIQKKPVARQPRESLNVLAELWGNRAEPPAPTDHEYHEQARVLEQKLAKFGIQGQVVNVVVGPVVVLYEYQPQSNIPLNKIIAREHDLALALEATSFRIIAPIPGKALVGFECSRVQRDVVLFADYHHELRKSDAGLPLLLGVTSAGKPMVLDLATLPHLLVAGSTGSGKSVVLHSIIMSIISSRSCDETQLILIDPKRLEFAVYTDIPHLLFPIVVEPREAIKVLRWLVQEMERRYHVLAEAQVTDSATYRAAGGELSDIVVVIDEWADLMMTGGKDAEQSLVRLAQMARAAGIHVVVATQRPSVDVITGLIKVNIPARIACKVISKVDSRTIIDMAGAEKLLGKGDMLVMLPGHPVVRGQGMYVSSREIQEVVCYVRRQRTVVYRDYTGGGSAALDVAEEDADLYQQVLDCIKTVDEVSISFLQRKLRIGYNRSARMIDYLEAHGMILPSDGGKTRKVVHSKDNI